jgi:predicted NAD-dependent protein-ADP-ribosyltransferase YbiA (DUF1768 family)
MKIIAILLILSSCANGKHNYPTSWWSDVNKSDLASWEISPSSADLSQNTVVLSKRNELGILSNFSKTPFTYRGVDYQSLEGLWQSMKFPESTNDPRNRLGIWIYKRLDVSRMIGFKAKAAGDFASKLMKKNKINWVSFKNNRMTYKTDIKGAHYKIIKEAMVCKLMQNEKVRMTLLSTGNLTLLPDHHTNENDPPAWKYYQIWMDLRADLHMNKEIICKS